MASTTPHEYRNLDMASVRRILQEQGDYDVDMEFPVRAGALRRKSFASTLQSLSSFYGVKCHIFEDRGLFQSTLNIHLSGPARKVLAAVELTCDRVGVRF